jgi:surfactin synthase thioesterase subunit
MTARTGHRPWLMRGPSEQAAGLLFCLPYSGCGASMYRRWPRYAAGVEICPVQVPGRENRIREAHYGTFEAAAEAICQGLAPFLDRPFAVFGHCSGALLAHAVAARLIESALPTPDRLFVSSQPAPGFVADGGFTVMSEAGLEAELVRLIRAMGGRPTADTLELYLSVYRPDLDAARAYRGRARIPEPTRITVVGWDGSGVSQAGLAGWSRYGASTFVDLAGGHYDFLSAPPELMQLLTSWVSSSGGARSPSTSEREGQEWTR